MDLIELKALEEVNELSFTESEREVILNNFSEMEKREVSRKQIPASGRSHFHRKSLMVSTRI